MRGIIRTAILAALITCLAIPALALAEMKVKVTNKSTQKVSLCLNYKDATSDEWVTRGWWSIDPLSSTTIKLNTNNKIAYFYATGSGGSWGGKKGQDGAIERTIVGDKFLVKDKNKPQGKNQRKVVFKKMQAKDRVYSINLQGN